MTVQEPSKRETGIPTSAPPVRLGVIDYLNVRPVYDSILRQDKLDVSTIETIAGVPSEMNQALQEGRIDISNVSSFALGCHTANWLLVPRLSVAAHGRVDSVLLFSWQPDWHALDGQSIALTSHSATSVELVRMLCERRYGIYPRYDVTSADLDHMLTNHAAALVIGDRALVERHTRHVVAGRGQPYVFDLAAEWQQWTGLPFVFAVWAARADRQDAIRASGVIALLRASKTHGLSRLDAIAAEYAVRLGLPQTVCAEYLRLLDYDLSARDLEGLRAFLEMAIPGFEWSSIHSVEE